MQSIGGTIGICKSMEIWNRTGKKNDGKKFEINFETKEVRPLISISKIEKSKKNRLYVAFGSHYLYRGW